MKARAHPAKGKNASAIFVKWIAVTRSFLYIGAGIEFVRSRNQTELLIAAVHIISA